MSRFLVIGDATLDVMVAPSRPLRAGGDVPATIGVGPGGQGANVAVRLARRGERVTLVAPIADDAGGRLLREALGGDGVEISAVPATGSAIVVALLAPGGERSMLSDRRSIDAAAVDAAGLEADWIHVSGYALLDDATGDDLAGFLAARPAAVRLSLAGGSIPPEPARAARFRERMATARPDILVLGREEAAALFGRPPASAPDAATALARRAAIVVVTAGEAGSAAAMSADRIQVAAPALPGPMVDATGAGDAYVAALASCLAATAWPPSAVRLRDAMIEGSRAGALVARVAGAQGRVAGEPGA